MIASTQPAMSCDQRSRLQKVLGLMLLGFCREDRDVIVQSYFQRKSLRKRRNEALARKRKAQVRAQAQVRP
jgi:hypothetical protein